MRRVILLSFMALFIILLLVYANWPAKGTSPTHADHVLIKKSERTLTLYSKGEPVKIYKISLGRNPVGPKQIRGDGKTPEGKYIIDKRNPHSSFHKSLHVSYPSKEDIERAKAENQDPGDMIMIHGIRNGLGFIGRLHLLLDWTNGCIAVTNTEMDDIWLAVSDGTTVEIIK